MKKKNLENLDNLSLSDQKKFILNHFDFDRVVHTMSKDVLKDYSTCTYHPWKMYINYEYKIPSKDELRNLADQLLTSLINSKEKYHCCRTGPFRAIKFDTILILDFVMCSESYD